MRAVLLTVMCLIYFCAFGAIVWWAWRVSAGQEEISLVEPNQKDSSEDAS